MSKNGKLKNVNIRKGYYTYNRYSHAKYIQSL